MEWQFEASVIQKLDTYLILGKKIDESHVGQ